MEVVFRKTKEGMVEHPIYTVLEADDKDIRYCYWKDADETSQWVVTDDEYVCEVMKFRRYRVKKDVGEELPWLQLPFCKTFIGERHWNRRLLWEPYRAGGASVESLGSPKKKDWAKQEAGTSRTKRAVQLYVAQLTAGVPVDWKAVGLAFRTDQRIPEASVRRVFKQEVVQKMIREELTAVYKDKGLDEAFVVDTLMEAKEIARFRNNALAMIKVAEVGRDLLEMNPKETKTRSLEEWEYKDENKQIAARVQRLIENGSLSDMDAVVRETSTASEG